MPSRLVRRYHSIEPFGWFERRRSLCPYVLVANPGCPKLDPQMVRASDRVGNSVGKILYGEGGTEIVFDDRDMAHLQLVIGAKLRRKESFFLSWKDDPASGEGRNSIWLDSAIPLYFKYDGSQSFAINREWLELLTISANSGQGMQFIAEPESGAPVEVPKK
jgi:hypothetical protein